MFIAFEGPDNTGKSTSALNLDCAGQPGYNVTKEMHELNVADWNLDGDAANDLMPHTYDRIDWFTHMVYRLALPDREWNDPRNRTVFAMPDTHLVVKLHRPDLANFTADEVVDTPIKHVNPMYWYFAEFMMNLNRTRDFSLFRSVTIMEVANEPGQYRQRVAMFDSRTMDESSALARVVHDDATLLELLQSVNHQEQ